MMPKHWTRDEDELILQDHYCGAGFVAKYYLDRPDTAGWAREAKLIRTGAARKYALAQIALLEYEIACGRVRTPQQQAQTGRELSLWGERAEKWA